MTRDRQQVERMMRESYTFILLCYCFNTFYYLFGILGTTSKCVSYGIFSWISERQVLQKILL